MQVDLELAEKATKNATAVVKMKASQPTNQPTNQPVNQTDTTDQVVALPGCLSWVRLPVEAYF